MHFKSRLGICCALLSCFLVSAVGFRTYTRTHTVQWQPYSQELEHQLQTSHKPYIMHFTGNFCISCQQQKLFIDNQVVAKKSSQLGITMIEAVVDHDKNKQDELKTLHDYGVPFVPAYIFVDKTGKATSLDFLGSTSTVLTNMDKLV